VRNNERVRKQCNGERGEEGSLISLKTGIIKHNDRGNVHPIISCKQSGDSAHAI